MPGRRCSRLCCGSWLCNARRGTALVGWRARSPGGGAAVNDPARAQLEALASALGTASAAAARLAQLWPAATPSPAAAPVFTVPTLAAHLHRSPSTIREWCEHGEIEATRVKGRWFIRGEAVERFLGGQRDVGPGRTILSTPNTRAGQRRARATGDVDLGAWRRVPRPEP